MRTATEELARRLSAPATTFCTCFRFERRDGRIFGAANHDQPLTFGGVNYSPLAGLGETELSWTDGLAPGRAFVDGVLDAEFMSGVDLDAGLWDSARVEIWRVDWSEPEHRLPIWSGRLSEVVRDGSVFRAELVSLKADLERRIGRTYARACDAEVGDAHCRVDLSLSAYRAESVATLATEAGVTASGLDGFADGWFRGGVVTWTSGVRAGLSARVASHAGQTLELAGPVGLAGDSFVVTAGCDKSFAMCGERFGNRDNFRGCPHMPGPDAVLAGPAAGAKGGRR